MRVALGIIFALFIVCFAAIIVEETLLGGRRRRKALKIARQRMIEGGVADDPTSGRARRN